MAEFLSHPFSVTLGRANPETCSELRLLPVAGVAIPLTGAYRGSLFCSLPLPQQTGLPVHVNGHFALDSEGRKNLFTPVGETGQNDARNVWNRNLLSSVVAPAYALGLELLKGLIFSDEGAVQCDVQTSVRHFYSLFPRPDVLLGDNLKTLASGVLTCVAVSETAMFASVGPTKTLTWHHVSEALAYFPEDALAGDRGLVRLLQDLDLVVLSCPFWICRALASFAPQPKPLTSATLVAHLKRCSPLKISNVLDLPKIKQVLAYCLKGGEPELHGLPLLFTADLNVRVFDARRPVYTYFDVGVFGKSVSELLHSDLWNFFLAHRRSVLDQGVFRSISLGDLDGLLQRELDKSFFCGRSVELDGTVDTSWFLSFWEQLFRIDRSADLAKLTAPLGRVALIPVYRGNLPLCVPVAEACNVFNRIDYANRLQMLDLPVLNSQFSKLLGPMCASVDNSSHVLAVVVNMYLNRQLDLSGAERRKCVLDYFMYYRSMFSDTSNVAKVKSLPVFKDLHGKFVPIGSSNVFVVPAHLKSLEAGHAFWGGGRTWLQSGGQGLSDLYTSLNLRHVPFFELYRDYVVPGLPRMDAHDQVAHLKNVERNIKVGGDHEQLRRVLSETAFVRSEYGGLHKLSDFYDPTVALYTILLPQEKLLPAYLSLPNDEGFLRLLRTIGLRHNPTTGDIENFAQNIASESTTDSKKLEALIDAAAPHRICNAAWWEDTFCCIPFIPRVDPPSPLDTLYNPKFSRKLFSLNELQRLDQAVLVWSVAPLAPPCADRALQYKRVTPELLVKHCLVIFPHVNVQLGQNALPEGSAREWTGVAQSLYASLLGCVEHDEIKKLLGLPLVVVNGGRDLACPEMVTLSPNKDIKPYLYSLSVDLQKFFGLFCRLGMTAEPSVEQYCAILQKIHDMGEGPHQNVAVISQVQLRLMKLAERSDEADLDFPSDTELYLLSSQGLLVPSREILVLSEQQRRRLGSALHCWDYVGTLTPSEADSARFLHLKFVASLPDRLKPRRVSDVLRTRISKSQSCVCSAAGSDANGECDVVRRLSKLFASPEFEYALEVLSGLKNLTHCKRTLKLLRNLGITCYSKLLSQEVDVDRGHVIEGSEHPVRFFMQATSTGGDQFTLHLVGHFDLEIAMEQMIKDFFSPRITLERGCETVLLKVLMCSQPAQIGAIFLKRDLSWNLPVNDACLLGEAVSPELRYLLDQSIGDFCEGQLVAICLPSSGLSMVPFQETEKLKFARIVRKLDGDHDPDDYFLGKYSVELGDGEDTVECSALYIWAFLCDKKTVEEFLLRGMGELPHDDELILNFPDDFEEAKVQVTNYVKTASKLPPEQLSVAFSRLMYFWVRGSKGGDNMELCSRICEFIKDYMASMTPGVQFGLVCDGGPKAAMVCYEACVQAVSTHREQYIAVRKFPNSLLAKRFLSQAQTWLEVVSNS